MNITKTAALLTVAGTLLAACSTTSKSTEPTPTPTPTVVKPQPSTHNETMHAAIPAYLDPNSVISAKRSVYFDFDNYTVKKDYASLIELQGKYLASIPNLAIRIEGNTDERGGSEYNLALGQKRAEAVRKSLAVYGVKDSQMEAVSFGKEKPKTSGHDEASWSQNRRADIQYPSK
jgi:peptidoglycan-associated lipoprotein